MLKKLTAISALCLCSLPAVAGSMYVGAGLQYMDIFSGDVGFQGIAPRLTLGYGNWLNESFYIGAEIWGSTKPFSLVNDTNSAGQGLSTSWNYGLSILPGAYLDDSLMGYLRASVMNTRFRTFNYYKVGYQIGIGVEYRLLDPVSLRAEYDFGQYPSFGGLSTPKASEVGVSVLYRFAP